MYNSKLLLLSVLLLLCFSCQKEDQIIGTEVVEEVELIYNDINLDGVVRDNNGEPIGNALITVGDKNTTTDDNGHYILNDIRASNLGTHVSVSSPGYFNGGKAINISSPGDYSFNLVLNQIIVSETFNAETGISHTDQFGAQVNIPANAIKDNNGLYTGAVTLSMIWLDPIEQGTFETMPGNLTARRSTGERTALLTYGMIGIDLRDNNGNQLNIAEGSTADLTFPIPSELLGGAPAEIPLWHFNETTGLWDEEGTAMKDGDEYLAQVSHFSWWNCDIPWEVTDLCISFVDENERPITNTSLIIELSAGQFGQVLQYQAGSEKLCIPTLREYEFDLLVKDGCGTIYASRTVGPFTNSAETIVITLNRFRSNLITINGVVTDCDGDAVNNGYLKYGTPDEFNIAPINDGEYVINTFICSDQEDKFGIEAVNFDGQISSETILISQSNGDVQSIDLNTCDDIVELETYISYTSQNNETVTSQQCKARVTAAETLITGENVILGIDGFDTGSFFGNFILTTGGNGGFDSEPNLTSISIENYGEINGYIIGSFENGAYTGSFIAERIQ